MKKLYKSALLVSLSATATLAFARAKQIDWRNAAPLAAIAVLSSVLGGLAALFCARFMKASERM